MDQVRVLRIIEYVGPRDKIEKQIAGSIQGTRELGNGCVIRAATIGSYPEVLQVLHDETIEDCGDHRGGYVCTERKGHSGDHIARTAENVLCDRWPQEEEAPHGA